MLQKTKIAEQLTNDRRIRRAVTQESFWWFLHLFFIHYLDYPLAPFHEEMIHLAESDEYEMVVVMAFRESGKSTILNAAYALWAILGRQQKKCVVIISNTQIQARNHFTNIKQELESNELLANDLGPFRSDEDIWGTYSLELQQLGAKIISVSRGQSIRGLRHNKHRPDLIICDDVEDTIHQSGLEQEELYRWFMDEVMPTGTEGTKYVVLGNLIAMTSLLMRLRKRINDGEHQKAVFRAYPFTDADGQRLWPQKFSTKRTVDEFKKKLPEDVWEREYLLQLYPGFTIILDGVYPTDMIGPELPPEQIPIIKKMQKYRIRSPEVRESGIALARKEFGI